MTFQRLHDRFVEAKLAGSKDDKGYTFRSNEDAADAAVQIVSAWLKEIVPHLVDTFSIPKGDWTLVILEAALDRLAASILKREGATDDEHQDV